MESLWSLASGAAAIGYGLKLLFKPEVINREAIEGYERRLAELDSGAEETYFEERRTLEAYKPSEDYPNWKRRVVGLILITVGAVLMAIGFYR